MSGGIVVNVGDTTKGLSGKENADGSIGAAVNHPDAFAQERNAGTSNQYGVGVGECNATVNDEADGTANDISSSAPALLFSVYVNESLAGGNMLIQDNGVTIIKIPGGLGAGTIINLDGMKFNTALVVNNEVGMTTGNITIGWRPQ